ncbi:hypothetical protein ACI2KS_10570 [Pseudomonas sp. NPDC087358]|uniref:hypothetical protein n=1 Tax=Pseudomonas sp. NPDC087358 TaxID=3364439 RepID=UPI00384E77CB
MLGKILMALGASSFALGFFEAQTALSGSHKAIESGLLMIIGLPLAIIGVFVWRASVKKRPACAERIKKQATACKHCKAVVGNA